jgi:hypothetical protein
MVSTNPLVISSLALALGVVLLGADPASAPTSTEALALVLTSTGARSEARTPLVRAHRPHWPAWIGAGTGVVCLGLGVYYRAVAHEAAVEAGRTSDMDTYTRDIGDAHSSRVLSSVLFVSAAVAIAGTLLYYFWPSGQD